MNDLPTIYHGIPKDDDDTRAVQEALQAVNTILNSVSPHLLGRLVSSVLLSVCCCQDDPAIAFQMIGENVGREIHVFLAKPQGSG